MEIRKIKIGDIKNLLSDYDVEINSPDGFVQVSEFVDKGVWNEYIVEDMQGNILRVNENHLFQTIHGWILTKDLMDGDLILKDDGKYHPVKIARLNTQIPIVDIVIEHENHRYYANGFSSHNTNVGKTLGLVHMASMYMKLGLNVLYITLEMAQEMISNRVDANLMNVAINDVGKLSEEHFNHKMAQVKHKVPGKLIVKEYPTSSAHVGHFRQLLQELQMKKGFKPDVIMIDYIGIAASSRVKLGNTGSYFYIKAIAEEFRGLAVEFDIPVWTAVQANRSGYASNDVEITDTAESFGLPATADFMIAFIRTDELDSLGQLLVKQLKNRYGNKSYYEKFVVGVNPDKMQLYEVTDSAQGNVVNSNQPVHDNEEKKEKLKNFKF